MYRHWMIGLCALSILSPAVVSAQIVKLQGKTTSKVTARVVKPNNLFVTDDKGGWFENLTMMQLGGWSEPYEVKARLRVTSSSGVFQVRLDKPLEIRNQARPSQMFRSPAVRLGAEGGEPKTLAVGQNTAFRNPPPAMIDTDSVGYYTLAISGYPPEGDFKSTVGTYTGVLSMTFEPIVTAP